MRFARLLLAGLLLMVFTPGVNAQECSGIDYLLKPVLAADSGFEQITVAAAALSLTVPANARAAVMVVETAAIRYRLDGTDPTVDIGVLVGTNESLTICGGPTMARFRMIRDTGTSATVNVQYYQ